MQDTKATQSPNIFALEVVSDLDSHPAHVYIMSLAPGDSRNGAIFCQNIAAKFFSQGKADRLSLNWGALRFQHIVALRAELAATRGLRQANKTLVIVRQTLKTAWRLNLISTDDYMRAIDIEPIRGTILPAGRSIMPEELAALMTSCDGSNLGIRNAAVLGLLYCGLRRREVIHLDRDCIDLDAKMIKVIKAKFNKQRLVPMMPGSDEAIANWIRLRGDKPGPLFWTVKKNDLGFIERRLSHENIWYIVARHRKLSGVTDITPHDFRRTMIGDLLDADVDIATVAQIVGHEDIRATKKYDRRGDRVKVQAMGRLKLPYKAP